MKRFYVASNRTDAYLMRDRLAHSGIATHVFNEHAQSIVGDVPPDVAQPQVWLDDDRDFARAAAVLREYHAERARTGTRHCAHCGEDNPATFDLCWQCGWNLPGDDA
jgi:putative signal transducing protein